MKKFILAAALMAAGCSSAPTPDPNNGVSPASYRQAITQADTNVAQIVSKLIALKARDQNMSETHSRSLYPASWWDAEIEEARQTTKLLDATLKGSTQ